MEDICRFYTLPKGMLHFLENTLKPRIGAVDETDATTKAHNSTLIEIMQTAAAYCRLLGKHKEADILDRCTHVATAHTKSKGFVTALEY